MKRVLIFSLVAPLLAWMAGCASHGPEFDIRKPPTPEEQAYFDRVKQEIRKRAAGKGEDGGLYGDGKNEPPEAHRTAYRKESEKILPLDASEKTSAHTGA